jgi:serine/threonine-protein kinase
MSDEAFDEMVRQAQARVGRVLKDKWTLDQLLGVGGMASVFAATHRNQKRVAIKMLHPELSFNAAVRQRFLREGYVANSVQHSGAVSVYDDDVTEDGLAFLVMDLLDGETLDARWERKGKRLPPGEVLALIDRVLDTLAAAHERGVVHRDLKPENLFFTRDAQVKVLDFGIARVRELSGGTKTQTGSLMGTPSFMPPEQARGRWEEVDGQSDLWAIGATMFTLLSGQVVHEATTVNEALVQAVTQPARSLGSVRPDLPSALVAFVDRALAYEKSARWPDAAAMQVALREAYAALETDWDEHTVLADAAAALPEGRLQSTHGPAVVTALVTSASARPTPARRQLPVVPIAVGAGLVGVIGILLLATSGKAPEAAPVSFARAAAPAVTESSARGATLTVSPAAPPPIAIDQLPAEDPKPKRVAATAVSSKPVVAPAVSAPVATHPLVRPQASAEPYESVNPYTKDPFAGRE